LLSDGFELRLHAVAIHRAAGPPGADTIAAKQAVLVLGEASEGHEKDVGFLPTGFCGDGKHLGG